MKLTDLFYQYSWAMQSRGFDPGDVMVIFQPKDWETAARMVDFWEKEMAGADVPVDYTRIPSRGLIAGIPFTVVGPDMPWRSTPVRKAALANVNSPSISEPVATAPVEVSSSPVEETRPTWFQALSAYILR